MLELRGCSLAVVAVGRALLAKAVQALLGKAGMERVLTAVNLARRAYHLLIAKLVDSNLNFERWLLQEQASQPKA